MELGLMELGLMELGPMELGLMELDLTELDLTEPNLMELEPPPGPLARGRGGDTSSTPCGHFFDRKNGLDGNRAPLVCRMSQNRWR
jgi:hypothetical protein